MPRCKESGVISAGTLHLICSDCKEEFDSPVLIRHKQKVVYAQCPICRQKRLNYNTNMLVYKDR